MWNSSENAWMEFKLRLDCFGLMEKVESTTIYLQYCRINRSFGLCTADLKQSSSNSFLLDLALGFLVVAASVRDSLQKDAYIVVFSCGESWDLKTQSWI